MAPLLISLIIGLPWLGAVCVWMVSGKRANWQHALAVIFSVCAGLAALALLFNTSAQAVIRVSMGDFFGDLTFVPDGLGALLAAVATVIGSLAVIFSVDYMKGEAQLRRYYFLVLFFIGSMAGLVLTGSLLFMFVFWEITALCSYALISFHNDDPKAVAGGIKALIITQIGGVGLLVGALVVYANLGSYDINNFLQNARLIPAAAISLIAFGFLIAAAAKSAQVPFHTWLPDAMEAPTPVSALIHAATMVNAGIYLLARFYPALSPVPYWRTSVIVIGLLSALLAGMMAMVANDLKRLLAYSTVSQLGFMVFAIGAGGVFASQFHLLNHAVFKALLFLGAGAIIHAAGTRDMRQMGGLGKQMPFVRAVFIIGALALAGVPILNGFWSKDLILEAGVGGSPQWALDIMFLGAGLTAFYIFRGVWMVFYGEPKGAQHVHDAPTAMRVALLPLAVGALTTWLLAGPLGSLLASTLPYHSLEAETTGQIVVQVAANPTTYIGLAIVALGLSAWWQRSRLAWIGQLLRPVAVWAEKGFGFESINQWIARTVRASAESLSHLQTGQLNWNLVGVISGLVFVLVWLAWRIR